jgi:hypothetical protein
MGVSSREAGSWPCPRHVEQAHAKVGTVNAGHARVQEGMVLEETHGCPESIYVCDGVNAC